MPYEATAAGTGQEAENAKQDLEEIKKNEPTIGKYLDQVPEEHPFTEISQIIPFLKEKVANPGLARAVRTVQIHTNSLYDRDGVVLHDVPGYDSPIAMHKEMARQELSRADAVIFVTNLAAQVSLNEHQIRMVDVADHEDPDINTHDKLFVFLNKIDAIANADDLKDRFGKAKAEWSEKVKKCRSDRLVPGSAGAFLFNKAECLQPASKRALKGVSKKLAELDPPFGDGVEHLQKLIRDYLENDRAAVLKKRCDELTRQGTELGQMLVEGLGSRYPKSLDELDGDEKVQETTDISNKFDDLWEEFQKDLGNFWNEKIAPASPDEDQAEHPSFARIHEAYTAEIERLKSNAFPDQSSIKAIHNQVREKFPAPDRTNNEVRRVILDKN